MKINSTHEIYSIDDFTPEEKYNTLAVAVGKGHVICKKCGDHDNQLDAACMKGLRYQAMMPRDKKIEDDLRAQGTIANNNESLEPIVKQSVNTNKHSDTECLDAIGKYGLSLSCDEQLVEGSWVKTWRCQHGMADDDVIMGNSIRAVIGYAIDANTKAINE
tara:strand:+ start:20248 stop:20730 length:483 start_codon:yes stop_codon:yes gene_type:complete